MSYYVGQEIKGITLLEKVKVRDSNHPAFKVRMPWGEERILRSSTFKKMRPQKTENIAMKGLLNTYKQNAKRRNLSWELTLKQFVKLTSSNCYYCGVQPKQGSWIRRRKRLVPVRHEYIYNGIDRKDNAKGYTAANCVPCCGSCNKIKGSWLTPEETLVAMKAVMELRKHKQSI